MSRIPPIVFHAWDFPSVTTVQHLFVQVHMELVIVCLCHTENLGFHSNNAHEILLYRIFRKCVENFKFNKFNKCDKHNECFS